MKVNNKKQKILTLLSVLSLAFALFLIIDNSNLLLNGICKVFDKANSTACQQKIEEYPMCVHFLDVGKADCIYIKCEDKNMLIDAADKDVSEKVVEYLIHQNVEKLDLVVVTHPHRDHIGQMSDVINKFKIGIFMMSDIPEKILPTTNTFKNMLKAVQDNNLKIKLVHAGEKFSLGNLKIKILSPCKQYDNLNNNSVVLSVEYGKEVFLFLGDAEKEAENDIIENGYSLKSSVVKIGHHGSNTSTGKDFLEKVSPKISVISVGEYRSKLPKKDVVKKIKDVGSKIYRTDIHGTIILGTNGNGIDAFTEKEAA